MADLPSHPESSGETNGNAAVGRASTIGMPRWVKVSLIVALVLVLAFVILKLAGVGGEHGPGRHIGPAGGGDRPPASGVSEHRPPPGLPDHGG